MDSNKHFDLSVVMTTEYEGQNNQWKTWVQHAFNCDRKGAYADI